MRKLGVYSILALLALAASGCSDTKLKKASSFGSIATGIDVCTTPADQIKTNLKFLFVVDRSGSNAADLATDGQGNPVWDVSGKGYTTCPGTSPAIPPTTTATKQFCPITDPRTQAPYPVAGTDPINCATGGPCTSRRFDPISAMAQTYPQDPSIFWSLVEFDDNARIAFPAQSGAGSPTFSTSNTGFRGSVTTAKTQKEGAYTNYINALKQMYLSIQTDINQQKTAWNGTSTIVGSSYVIFFISDGAPWIQDPAGVNPFGVEQDMASIKAQVDLINQISALNPEWVDSITLNTAYYYRGTRPTSTAGYDPDLTSFDFDASTRMQTIATWGGGRYLDFGAGQNVDLSRFQVPTRTAKFRMLDLWAKDVSAVWWNGRLMKDSDGDGLPDDIEYQLGSDANKYDTDGDGVGDGVYYNQYLSACQGGSCAPYRITGAAPADPPPQCPVSTAVWNPTTRQFADSDKDFLNDCEEVILGSDPRNFDSNKDLVPDWMEYISGVAFTGKQGIDLLSMPDGDGVTNYQKMKWNYPVGVDYRTVDGLRKLSMARTIISDSPTQTCYHYDINDLATWSNDDLIRVMMVEERVSLGSKILMRSAQKKLVGGVVQFSDGDFQ